tara:strand:+ start:380 stop:1441 length:1062 start_codon:yes stop_codon:yes gene_type:complete
MSVSDLWNRLKSGEPFFIAEAGVNHLGSLELGERLIKEAKKAGAHAIKFQSYKASTLCTKDAPRFWDWEGEIEQDGSQYDSYSHLDSFGAAEHIELKRLCDSYGIEFMSTPFDFEAVDYLDDLGIRAFKVASCDVTNHPLLERIASTGKIVMLSTGASTIEEVAAAVQVLQRGTSMVVVMHCNLRYPTADDEINLRMINHLAQTFPDCIMGLSDHTMNMWTPAIAHAMGASVIERHFTVDKTLGTSADHWLSADPTDVSNILQNINFIDRMLGTFQKEPTVSEIRARKYARRSVVAARKIIKGEIFDLDNLACKRPGTGISPSKISEIVGCEATKDIPADHIITTNDFKGNSG